MRRDRNEKKEERIEHRKDVDKNDLQKYDNTKTYMLMPTRSHTRLSRVGTLHAITLTIRNPNSKQKQRTPT